MAHFFINSLSLSPSVYFCLFPSLFCSTLLSLCLLSLIFILSHIWLSYLNWVNYITSLPSSLDLCFLLFFLSIVLTFFFQYNPLFLAILFFLFFDITVSLSFFSTSKKYSSFHSFNSKLIQTLFSSSLSFDSTHSFIRYYLFFR